MTTNTTKPRRHWFWDRPIASKITASLLVLGGAFALVGGGGAVALYRASTHLQEMSELTGTLQSAMSELRAASDRSHLLFTQAAVSDPNRREQVLTSMAWVDGDVATQIAIIDEFPEVHTQQWSDFKERWAAWVAYRDATLLPLLETGDLMKMAAAVNSDAAADADWAGRALALAEGQVNARVDEILTKGRNEVRITIIALFAGFIVAAGTAGAVSAAVTRRVSSAVNGVAKSLDALAEGDLTVEVEVTSNDETGRMAASLNRARGELREAIGGAVQTAADVASAAQLLARSNQDVSASARGTSAQAGVAADAAEQVSINVQAVAAGAEQMGASITEISQNASGAAKVAQAATQAATQATASVARLGDSSQEIGNVVKLINAIAEQTNLLALNATIEAARAGEAGRGFAVVAGEVKALASETAQATEDIAQRVQAIQQDTTDAVATIEEISSIVASINDYQLTIASAVEEQTATTNEMSRGVREAAASSAAIADNINGVAETAEHSTQVLDAVVSQVDELAALSTALHERVSRFTV